MLVWVTLVAGLVVLAVGAVAVTRVDRRWRPRHQRCCRCQEAWFGEGKFCGRCGARGRDWLDTGPVSRIELPRPREPFQPQRHRTRG